MTEKQVCLVTGANKDIGLETARQPAGAECAYLRWTPYASILGHDEEVNRCPQMR
jgi:NAD(P)-dependent dehydrogenase (short-subunit alcohol dehydrogenase family)